MLYEFLKDIYVRKEKTLVGSNAIFDKKIEFSFLHNRLSVFAKKICRLILEVGNSYFLLFLALYFFP